MNTNSHSTHGENDNKKGSAEEIKAALLKSPEIPPADDKGPVGPFEHSGEVSGWTETEEKQEISGEESQQQTGNQAKEQE